MANIHLLWLTSLIIPIIGAVVGLRASRIEVRDSLDDFINDIKRQSLWTTWVAIITSMGAVVSAAVNWHAG